MAKQTYYERNKARILAKANEYYQQNKEKVLQQKKEFYKRRKAGRPVRHKQKNGHGIDHRQRVMEHKIKNPEYWLWMSAKASARKRGLEFTITKEDICIPKRCPLLGVGLTYIQGQGRIDTNISIDRIDNTKGYIPGNIWVICDLANRMKNSASQKELKRFAAGIVNIFFDRYLKVC